MKKTMDINVRFFSHVNKTESCWYWTARLNKAGYGEFNASNKRPSKTWLAHRFSYFLIHGDIEHGKYILHKCDNPKCVNPEHLFIGTQKENMSDCSKKGRHPRNATKYLPEGKSHHFYNKGVKITREIANTIKNSIGTQKSIADKYNISPSLVSMIKSGKIWKD